MTTTATNSSKKVSLNQITVSTRRYESSHWKKPRGYGMWGFAIGSLKAVDEDIYKAWWPEHSMTYTDAVKAAKKEAQKRGETIIHVLS